MSKQATIYIEFTGNIEIWIAKLRPILANFGPIQDELLINKEREKEKREYKYDK